MEKKKIQSICFTSHTRRQLKTPSHSTIHPHPPELSFLFAQWIRNGMKEEKNRNINKITHNSADFLTLVSVICPPSLFDSGVGGVDGELYGLWSCWWFWCCCCCCGSCRPISTVLRPFELLLFVLLLLLLLLLLTSLFPAPLLPPPLPTKSMPLANLL